MIWNGSQKEKKGNDNMKRLAILSVTMIFADRAAGIDFSRLTFFCAAAAFFLGNHAHAAIVLFCKRHQVGLCDAV